MPAGASAMAERTILLLIQSVRQGVSYLQHINKAHGEQQQKEAETSQHKSKGQTHY